MKDLLTYLVQNLVTKPDEVKIEEETDNGALTFKLTVAQEDMGIVIGKAGTTIKSIRKMLIARALAEGSNLRVFLNLQEVKS